MARLRQFLPALVFLFSGISLAQTTAVTEVVSAHLNANAFVSGETIYYSLNCGDGNGKPSRLSKVAYAELVASDRKSVFTHKIFLENANGSGDFFIPPSLPSGTYKFIAYTRWMQNAPADKLCQTEITIVNPFVSLSKAETAASAQSFPKMPTSALRLSKPSFATREKVVLQLPETVAARGQYSLSVRKKDRLSELKSPAGQPSSVAFSSDAALAELRGELLSGTVTDQSGLAVKNAAVAFSIPSQNYAAKIAKTNDEGRFFITLEQPVYEDNILVQAIGQNREKLTVSMSETSHPDYSALKFGTFTIPENLKDDLRQHSVSGQVENAYFARKKDSVAGNSQLKPFYAPLGKTFALDDYTRFPTFKETVVEVLENTSFTQSGGKYELHVRDFHPEIKVDGPTLVLADGIFIEDASELFEYPANEIKAVTIIQGIYYYGPKAYNGVVSVSTKSGNYALKSKGKFVDYPKILRPSPKKRYFSPDYATDANSRIPDYRCQLAWIPNVAQNSVSFYTSDVKGTFEAVLEGVSENGSPVYEMTTFEVR